MSIEPFSQALACLADVHVGRSTHSASREVNYTYRRPKDDGRPKNLRDIVVHTKPARNCKSENRGNQPGTYPCVSSSRCKTCAIVKNLT